MTGADRVREYEQQAERDDLRCRQVRALLDATDDVVARTKLGRQLKAMRTRLLADDPTYRQLRMAAYDAVRHTGEKV